MQDAHTAYLHLRWQRNAEIRVVLYALVQQLPPVLIARKHARVANDDQQRLSACDGDVEALWIGQETEAVLGVEADELIRGAHRRDDDHAPLLRSKHVWLGSCACVFTCMCE